MDDKACEAQGSTMRNNYRREKVTEESFGSGGKREGGKKKKG